MNLSQDVSNNNNNLILTTVAMLIRVFFLRAVVNSELGLLNIWLCQKSSIIFIE